MLARFFVAISPLQMGQSIELDEKVRAHIRALRLHPGALLELFNGNGLCYGAKLLALNSRHCLVQIESEYQTIKNRHPAFILLQCFSTPAKMDWVMQKSTELGVTEIYPVISRYSNLSLHAQKNKYRHDRWRSIIISACEQSGVNILPILHPLSPLEKVLQGIDADLKLLFDTSFSTDTISINPDSLNRIALLIGPEGGFSKQERQLAKESGFQNYHLGPRVLRTETAPIAALSHLHTLFGDYVPLIKAL